MHNIVLVYVAPLPALRLAVLACLLRCLWNAVAPSTAEWLVVQTPSSANAFTLFTVASSTVWTAAELGFQVGGC